MMHPLASRLAPLMDGDLTRLRSIVAEWVLQTTCDQERAALRAFGSELGAVQRRIRSRAVPPSQEEIEIALTAVLALANRRTQTGPRLRMDPAQATWNEPLRVAAKGPLSS